MRDHHNDDHPKPSSVRTTRTTIVSTTTAKSESDMTSNPEDHDGSSPPPADVVYYVQSPSRDYSSHDGEKTINSFHSSPPNPLMSPMASPPHDGDTHSNSSSTRFSGSLKPPASSTGGGTVITTTTGSSSSERINKHGEKFKGGSGSKKWGGTTKGASLKRHRRFDKIEEEEGLLGVENASDGIMTKRCRYVVGFVVGFSVLFTFFSVVLWGASRNQKPFIMMKSVRFDNFVVQSGTDINGVPTAMTTVNATVKLVYRNRGTFFGVHVTSTPLNLSYRNLLILASGTIERFYQGRDSKRSVVVRVGGTKIPLYGGGSDLAASSGEDHAGGLRSSPPVGLTLSFQVTSRAYVLGRLVKPRFRKEISCELRMSSKKMNKLIPLRNLCSYQ